MNTDILDLCLKLDKVFNYYSVINNRLLKKLEIYNYVCEDFELTLMHKRNEIQREIDIVTQTLDVLESMKPQFKKLSNLFLEMNVERVIETDDIIFAPPQISDPELSYFLESL
jgi:hypothetical protein